MDDLIILILELLADLIIVAICLAYIIGIFI